MGIELTGFELASIGLGAFTLVVFMGGVLTSHLVRRGRQRRVERRWLGTVGTVSTPIPADGVGRVTHFRRGVRSSLPARMIDRDTVPCGAPVVIVEVRDGVALLALMNE